MLQIVIAFFLSDYFELEFFSEKKKKMTFVHNFCHDMYYSISDDYFKLNVKEVASE